MTNLTNDINTDTYFTATFVSATTSYVEITQLSVGLNGNTNISGTALSIVNTNDSSPCMWTIDSGGPSTAEFTEGTDAGSSAGTSQNTLTYQVTPTTNTQQGLQTGAQSTVYGKFGVRFYADPNSANYHGNNTSTYFGNPSENTTDGRLNQIGVWDDTTPFVLASGNNQSMTPYDQWVGFSECITVPSDGEYLIGLAGDNRFRILIDNQIIKETNTDSTENFNHWWVYKVNLTAGDHVINMEGWNSGQIASFGCDVVGPFPTNTFIDETIFANVESGGVNIGGTTYNDLEDLYSNNIIFTTETIGSSATDTCTDKTDTLVTGNGASAAISQLTYLADNNALTYFNAFTYGDTATSGTTDVCIDGSRGVEKLFITHITIDTSNYPSFYFMDGNAFRRDYDR